jgi:hypothetical protein
MFCEYKDSLGKVGQGVHTHVMGVAIADIIMTIIGAYLFHRMTGYSLWKCVVGLFLLGILLHRLFCVRTTIDKLLFHH